MTNETKHTPGPWNEGAGNGEGLIFASEGRMRMAEKGTTLWPICKMFTGWDEAEDVANARLIAAAPALLEVALYAAETIADYLNSEPRDDSELEAAQREIEHITAKAKGGR